MINIFDQSIAFGNTTSISQLKSDIESDLKNSIPQETKNYSLDNVFLVTHRWQTYNDNFPLAIKPEYYSGYTKETFDGVLVVEGDHNIVVAKDDVQLPWAPGTNAFTLDSSTGKYSYNADPHNANSNTNTGNTYFNYNDNTRRDLMSDFNGRQYTQKIFSDDSYAYNDGKVKWKDIPDDSVIKYAPGYCYKYSTSNQPTHINYPDPSNGNNNIYGGIEAGQWWLPSIGELWMMYSNFNKINYCMSLIGGKPLVRSRYWSSTESGSANALSLSFADGIFYHWSNKSQGTDGHVRPVSAFYA